MVHGNAPINVFNLVLPRLMPALVLDFGKMCYGLTNLSYLPLLQVKEMPNVLILPRSADYSEEVWMEIRDKAISLLQSFFFDGIIPKDAIPDEEEESDVADESEQFLKQDNKHAQPASVDEQLKVDILLSPESSNRKGNNQSTESPSQSKGSGLSQTAVRSEERRSRSGKKAKKRHGRQKAMKKSDDPSQLEKDSSHQDDGAAMSGTDQVLSSSSRFGSPEDSRSRKTPIESMQESTSDQLLRSSKMLGRKSGELLKDGCVIALYARDRPALHVSRQRVKGGGWFLDAMSNVTKRDPAVQFLVVFRSKVCPAEIFCHFLTICSLQHNSSGLFC